MSLTCTAYRSSALGFLVVAAIICCFACNDKKGNAGYDKKKVAVEIAKDVVVNYTQGGNIRGRLKSPLMLHVQDTMPYVEFPNTLHVDFYNGDTIIQSRLDAKYAKYTESKSLVFLRDSVRVISINGDTLISDQLYWDRNRKGLEFYTTTPVIVKTKTHIIYGQKGMEISQDLKNKNFYEVTNSILRVPSSQFPD